MPDIHIKYTQDGRERNDVVMPFREANSMAEQATYDLREEAQIEIKGVFSSGTSTALLRVRRVSRLHAIVSCRPLLIQY